MLTIKEQRAEKKQWYTDTISEHCHMPVSAQCFGAILWERKGNWGLTALQHSSVLCGANSG